MELRGAEGGRGGEGPNLTPSNAEGCRGRRGGGKGRWLWCCVEKKAEEGQQGERLK